MQIYRANESKNAHSRNNCGLDWRKIGGIKEWCELVGYAERNECGGGENRRKRV